MAIISEAASSGISLQADRRVKVSMNREISLVYLFVFFRIRDVAFTLRWSCLGVLIELYSNLVRLSFVRSRVPYLLIGRTHRSNQTSAPEYLFLISELAGERRFASIVAKRLECLVRSRPSVQAFFL